MGTAIVGSTGFVGSHIVQWIPLADCYRSSNISNICGKTYDTVFCSCVPAVKWIANKDPDCDARTIQTIKEHLSKVRCTKRFVLISTIDVHDHTNCRAGEAVDSEDGGWDLTKESYGSHRFEFEQWCLSNINGGCSVYIIRLPALFGFGLRKNIIFDLLTLNRLEWIHPEDSYQWYDLQWLSEDIQIMFDQDIRLLHAYPQSLSNNVLITNAFPHLMPWIGKEVSTQRGGIVYEHGSKYSFVRRSKQVVLDSLQRFIDAWMVPKERIAVSSFQWTPSAFEDERAAIIMKMFGVHNIELVPWTYIPVLSENGLEKAADLRSYWDEKDMKVASLQAIFFGIQGDVSKPETKVDVVERALYSNKVANVLGAKAMVFGAPSLRTNGSLADLKDILSTYNEHVDVAHAKLCLEHVATDYKCSLACTICEVDAVIRSCKEVARDADNTEAIGTNWDLGNMFMEGDSNFDMNYAQNVAHIQISMPHLKDIDIDTLDNYYPISTCLPFISERVMISMEVKSDISHLSKNLYTFMCWLGKQFRLSHKQKKLIVGCGWYGCHLATLLEEKGVDFDMIDMQNGFCIGSSSKNQNRLHLGFHYPRSAKTRRECFSGFPLFMRKYSDLTQTIRNFYFISKQSLLDFETYCSIFTHDGIPFEIGSWKDIQPYSVIPNMFDGFPISVAEQFIDPRKVQEYFSKRFEHKRLDFTSDLVNAMHYDTVFDCTYGRMIKSHGFTFETCFTVVLEMIIDSPPIALTVMDGMFFSIYPYDIEAKLYTLTHVEYTPVSLFDPDGKLNNDDVTRLMINHVKKHIANFDNLFKPVSSFVSNKTKVVETGADDRSVVYERRGRIHSFMGGKITGIFEIDNIVTSSLGKETLQHNI